MTQSKHTPELLEALEDLRLLVSDLEIQGKLPEIGNGQSKASRAVLLNKAAKAINKARQTPNDGGA